LGYREGDLAGPAGGGAHDAERGYLDTYFTGWLDPARLKLWDYATRPTTIDALSTMPTPAATPNARDFETRAKAE